MAKGFALKVGLQMGFLASAKGKVSAAGESYSLDIKDECKSFEFSLPLGLSYDVMDNIVLDLRYNLGLTSAAKDADGDGKNSVFKFTVGYRFNLGKFGK